MAAFGKAQGVKQIEDDWLREERRGVRRRSQHGAAPFSAIFPIASGIRADMTPGRSLAHKAMRLRGKYEELS
jgi:hypothetical protein